MPGNKKQEVCPPKGAPAYMMTYGDLMTLLLTLFVLLLSFSSMREAKFRRAIGSLKRALGVLPHEQAVIVPENVPIPQLSNLQESEISESIVEMQEATSEMDVAEAVKLETTKEGILITISDSVLFDQGRARLKDPILPLLASIANIARGWPNKIVIFGHTDSDPIRANADFRDNWELSFGRSMEVLRFFALQGLEEEHIIPIPMSEYKPIDSNDTVQGKSKNRRVEILIRYDRDSDLPQNVWSYLNDLNINY